ncbi:LysR family transcriptional regulator [Variovorax fucosicus]|uniref:LysR family transcriptional regulator n=1 Tax=Variovorax fucosicus TaxID=3053517 RepID=UPI002577DD7F|nr:LysR family transcriptional regulator [Variovorax sp. J22G47]MDM0058462.1 LysR family transcriptional regulator [Variovorax sp. J22G47]
MLRRRELALLRAMYLHHTVTAAAAVVHISQPAASALLRDLETRLGFALFSRDNRRLALTSQGRLLMPEVLNALAAIEAADRVAIDIRQGATDRLNVGAVAVAASMLLPPAFVAVRHAFPHITLTVRAGTAVEIVEMASDHRVDLGIIISGEVSFGERVATERLASLSLHVVTHADHLLAQIDTEVSLQLALQFPLIVLSSSLPAGLATRKAIEAAGLEYAPAVEVMQSSTACAFAGAKVGVAIVESLGAMHAQRQGLVAKRLLTLKDSALTLVWPKDRPLEGACLKLRQSVIEVVEHSLDAALPRTSR